MLIIGDVSATEGMTKAIYEELRSVLEPDLAGLSEDKRVPIRENWKKMSNAIATGVINHILSNMEITGIQTQGNISANVSGNTGTAAPSAHLHTVGLTASQNGVTFTQSNNGTGRVR